jgi:predicted alpha/beta hydrolase family esterase
VPYQVPPYRSIVVASSNDPYCPVRKKGGTDAQAAEFVAKLHTVK